MVIENYLPQDALCIEKYEDAVAIQKLLMENGYCVMMSREDDFYMLNWVWSEMGANRNDVIFLSRMDYECAYANWQKEHLENSAQ